MEQVFVNEETIPVPGRNRGDYVKEAALIGGMIGGLATAGAYHKPDASDQPAVIKNSSKNYAEAILADRMKAERMR